MSKSETPTIRLRIDLAPDSALGPGKIALLEHIEATGSLSQAARELGMSYRRAWLLLNDVNRMFAEPATTASVGGAAAAGRSLRISAAPS
jgi:molybdate transport system regulatory protein